ncbi:MAG: DUF799 family lipoprotein [Pseudomonadota bacterium]
MQRYFIVLLLLIVAFGSGCAKSIPKEELFPQMYTEAPKSIVVLPPMNITSAVDAKGYYSTTLAEPFSENGYYVFSIPVTSELLKSEGVYDTELLYELPVAKFHDYFGADAVLFTTINKWDLVYYVIGGHLAVGFDCELRSTKTENILWKHSRELIINLTPSSGNLLVDIIATAINAAIVDYIDYARQANYLLMNDMPYGPYHKEHLQDGKKPVIIPYQKPSKAKEDNAG